MKKLQKLYELWRHGMNTLAKHQADTIYGSYSKYEICDKFSIMLKKYIITSFETCI
jgi:hypothetical protein